MSYTTSSASTNYPNVRTVATPNPATGSVIELFNANAEIEERLFNLLSVNFRKEDE